MSKAIYSPLAQSRYEIANALGYVKHTSSWAIPYTMQEHLQWGIDFKLRCVREDCTQYRESGFQAKDKARRAEREFAWEQRRAKRLAAERGE